MRRVIDDVAGDAGFEELTKINLTQLLHFCMHGKTCSSVYSDLKDWIQCPNFESMIDKHTIRVLVNNCLHNAGQTVFRKVHIGSARDVK